MGDGNARLDRVLAAIAALPEKYRLPARQLARAIWNDTKRGKRGTFYDGEELFYITDLEPRAALVFVRQHGPALAGALGLEGEYVKAGYSHGSGIPFGGGRVQAGGYRGAYNPAGFMVAPRR